MIKKNYYLLSVLSMFLLSTKTTHAQSSALQWNGYIQSRLESNFNTSTEFMIRRAKLWVYGNVKGVSNISYKVQMVYRSFKDESFAFEDAFGDIHLNKLGFLRIGRFVPDFMLERSQPDYLLPVMERAMVVNSMVHNEKQLARETGLQYTFRNDALPLHFSFGVFNANVDEPAHSKDNFLLYTSRLAYTITLQKKQWFSLGGSVSYRHINHITLTTIYKADSLLSGNDFRWGGEARIHWNNLKIQGEYIQAIINKDKAYGWYLISSYSLLRKYRIVALTEKYRSLNTATNPNTWYGLGFNYMISGRTKVMTDIKTQSAGYRQNFQGDLQLQIFFN